LKCPVPKFQTCVLNDYANVSILLDSHHNWYLHIGTHYRCPAQVNENMQFTIKYRFIWSEIKLKMHFLLSELLKVTRNWKSMNQASVSLCLFSTSMHGDMIDSCATRIYRVINMNNLIIYIWAHNVISMPIFNIHAWWSDMILTPI
jgi:hypothetical protein